MARSSSVYPLWIGLLAFAAIGGAWWTQQHPAVDTEAADAGVDAGAEPRVGATAVPTMLRWRIVDAELPSPETLKICLVGGGFKGAQITTSKRGLVVQERAFLESPITVNTQGADLILRTPLIAATRHPTIALHFAVGACFSQLARALEDPVTLQ